MQDGFFAPLGRALKSFLFEVETKTAGGPHIRDGVDLKRWMMLVVYAMLPCAIMAVWNTGVQSLVYSEG
ncbi:MAG: RnfABCDGE type electron transport complex subunit D, partial [Simkaniaceae bacterium]|nr:RnfABCDGE type electron transport complex subunit D [Simkaniaceae bacterium]